MGGGGWRMADGLVYMETEVTRRRPLLEVIFGSVGADAALLPPVVAGSGGGVHLGDGFFGNFGNVNLTQGCSGDGGRGGGAVSGIAGDRRGKSQGGGRNGRRCNGLSPGVMRRTLCVKYVVQGLNKGRNPGKLVTY